MPTDGQEDLNRMVAGGSIVLALKERLKTGQINEEDQKNIKLTRLIVQRRNEGKSWREISAEVARPEPTITGYAKRGVHRAIVEWINAPSPTPAKLDDPPNADLDDAAAGAMQFIKDALAKNPDGTWKNEAMAMWATERLAARGLIDVVDAQPIYEIKLHTVKEIMDQADADEEEAAFRAKHQGAAHRVSAGAGEGESSATPQPETTVVQ